MRKLKHHEFRLLRKADFLQWKREAKLREISVCRRYRLSSPDEYYLYNKIVGDVKHLCNMLRGLSQKDDVRAQLTQALVKRLHELGIISVASGLDECANINVSALCRRRLPVVMVRLKFAENLNQAVTLVEQGHMRIGPAQVKNPALLVSRSMEDYLTWMDTSKIRRKVSKFNDNLDDYDLLNA